MLFGIDCRLKPLIQINRMILGICLALFTSSAMASSTFPSLEAFNRSVNAGSSIELGILYENHKTDILLHGMEEAGVTEWDSHSTLTTSLFPLATGQKRTVSYAFRSEVQGETGSSLWVEVRYYDKHGVNIDKANGDVETAPGIWTKRSIALSPTKPGIEYAEIWFVKYENARQENNNKSEEPSEETIEHKEGNVAYKGEVGIYLAGITAN